MQIKSREISVGDWTGARGGVVKEKLTQRGEDTSSLKCAEGMAADSRAFERMTFSDFTCAEDLTKAFGNTYIARPTVRPPSTVLPRFVRADMTDTEWGAACDAYADFFAEGDISGNTRSHEVEGPLRPLFDFVALNAGPGLSKTGRERFFCTSC